ncbi:hypothetical protein [Achromobacter pulmonis]|uniref:hypothetical protein n=1 Tax=Achromobacter pulmonis TaxID=1389932 RepID=UPI0011B25E05|nr:hypothetical protein [Achromobacter pulmonis]
MKILEIGLQGRQPGLFPVISEWLQNNCDPAWNSWIRMVSEYRRFDNKDGIRRCTLNKPDAIHLANEIMRLVSNRTISII